MAGRLALVVGTQCNSLPELSFVQECAADLHDQLMRAGWQPVGAPDGLLVNQRIAELKKSVESAFGVANEAGATLLLTFIGHGEARGTHNFYLMAVDSLSGKPNSENAFHLPQFVNERLIDFPSLDGVVFLVDACQAKEGVEGAAARWTEVLAANRGRMELLVASGADSAYDGCFTKTILSTFKAGRDIAGENLLCADLQPQISDKCWRSQTQYLAYSGGNLTSGDPGLWLMPNIARSRDAVTGRPAAGLVDQLTTGAIVTDTMRETLATIEESAVARLRLLVGAAGSGKSTLLGLLIRPKKAKKIGATLGVADDYIKAAVFLDTGSTLETLAVELAAQLVSTVPEFGQAAAAVAAELTQEDLASLDTWEINVVRPLARCARSGRIHVIVDGLDQPEPGAREVLLTALQQLTLAARADELGHVRVIAGVRSGEGIDTRDELAHACRIDIAVPAVAQIARAATTELGLALSDADLNSMMGDLTTGGWLIARLLREIADHVPDAIGFDDLAELVSARTELALRGDSTGAARKILGLIAAAGVGPVLPIRLLAAALGGPDTPLPLGQVRNRVVKFGTLLTRSRPGTDRETLGLAHQAFLQPIDQCARANDLPLERAHRALIDAYERHFAATEEETDAARDDVAGYWTTSAPRHFLGCGDSEGAIEVLEGLDTARAADNRDRWAGWLPAFTATLGADHRDTLTTRHNLAYWRAEAGDPAGAAAEFEALLADLAQILGPDHPDILTARNNLAFARGEAGDAPGAITDYQALLADQLRVRGADHPDTLAARNNLAYWRGKAGDAAGAAGEFEALLADLARIFGLDDPGTLTTRNNLALWRGEAGDAAGAAAEFEALLADLARVHGADHPHTLSARNNLAYWRGQAGDPAGAAAEFETLLADRMRVLGADHPHTLITRGHLARWRGEAGDTARAITDYEAVLADQVRVLGPDHPDTVKTRHNLAQLHGEESG